MTARLAYATFDDDKSAARAVDALICPSIAVVGAHS
jgi:hypothetical protein